MVEVVDRNTGEIREVEKVEEALDMVERPPYWRRARGSYGFYTEGESGQDWEKAFFNAQKEIGPVIYADSTNDFNKSTYASLGGMLSKISAIVLKHGLSIRQGTGKLQVRNDLSGKIILPVWLQLTHVDSLQWQVATVEMPLIKFDAQSYKAAVTFGRRTALEAFFCVAPTDDDGVSASHQLAPEQLDQMMDGMIEKIDGCEDEVSLRKWLSENKQQFEMLGTQREEKLKHAWQGRLGEVKPKVAKKGKGDV